MKPVFDPAVLAGWCGGQWSRLPSVPVQGACHDTRELMPGDLFVALAGNRDGHEFVQSAFTLGAAAALVRSDWPAPAGFPCLAVRDPLAALQAIARAHRLASRCRIVGVTGSAGKSTVKEMTAALLESRWPTARTRGNFNNAIGLPISLMTLVPGHHRFGVFEAGTNHPGEIAELCGVLRPDWGIVTNVGPVHVEYFKTVEGVALEKRNLLAALPKDGVAVINRDSACFDLLVQAAPGRVLTASLSDSAADLRAEAVEPGGEGQRIRVREKTSVHEIRLSVPGRHNVVNALLASLVARETGLSWREIDAALSAFTPLEMRWQVSAADGITVINDAYNANPLSMAAALDTFRAAPCAGRKWLVLGDMRELGDLAPGEHARVGALVAAGPWAGLVAVGALSEIVAREARARGFPADRIECVPDSETAGAVIRRRLAKGDAVLLKASRGVRLERVARALGVSGTRGGH